MTPAKTNPVLGGASDRGAGIEHFNVKITPPSGFKQHAKQLIVTLALWGCLPIAAANWLIRRGGSHHD